MSMENELDRASGCLHGVAIADALGAATTFLSPAQIRRRFGFVDTFLKSAGSSVHSSLSPGEFTDDTELTLVLARSIIDERTVSAEAFARHLLLWAKERDILQTTIIGPSTRRAIQSLMSGGSVHESGKGGTTNGCAMRISPVGIFSAGRSDTDALAFVEAACMPTHCTRIAIAGAAAICIAVKKAMEGVRDVEQIVQHAISASMHPVCSVCNSGRPRLHLRIRHALEIAKIAASDSVFIDRIYSFMLGKRKALTEDAVPIALSVFRYAQGDFNRTALICANMGGDCDTIGAIAGAISGAYSGLHSIRRDWIEGLRNADVLAETARRLLDARN